MTAPLIDRVLEAMRTTPAPKVRRVESEEGCYVNRGLQQQATYFLTWTARDKRTRP